MLLKNLKMKNNLFNWEAVIVSQLILNKNWGKIRMSISDKIMIMFGVMSLVVSLITKTRNLQSSIMLKVIPFFSGIYIIFYVLLLNNIISIN